MGLESGLAGTGDGGGVRGVNAPENINTLRDWVTIKLENSFCGEDRKDNGRSGIGLENVRRRLAILFPGRHELSFFSENNSYLVILKLKSYQYENKMPVG